MSIQSLIATRSSRYATSTDPTEILLMALGEIQAELSRLSVNVSIPDINISGLEDAIRELNSSPHAPLPPQNLDLNPVIRSYEETSRAIKELLGEVKTTNHRMAGLGGGGGGPSVVGINDANGTRLKINEDGSINTTSSGESGGASEATLSALLSEFRNKYDVVSTAKATYTTSGNHTLISPPPGQSLRPVWLYAQAKGVLDTGTVLVTFTLGPNSYEVELTGSQPFAHGAVWEGAVDQPLIVNTSSTAAVLINVDYRVF